MNLRRIVFDFLTAQSLNPANAHIYGAKIEPDRYTEIKQGGGYDGNVWIRLDNIKRYETEDVLGGIRQINAPVEIQIVVRPQTQIEADRRDAEESVTAIALELAKLFYDNERLNDQSGSVCRTAVLGSLEEWIKISDKRHAVGYVILVINPKK